MRHGLIHCLLIVLVLGLTRSSDGKQVVTSRSNNIPPGKSVQWLIKSTDAAKLAFCQLKQDKSSTTEIARFSIDGYDEPALECRDLRLSTVHGRYLYLLLDLPSPAQISLYFKQTAMRDYDDAHQCLLSRPVLSHGLQAFRLDMTQNPEWKETIQSLRILIEGMRKGTIIGLGGMAASSDPQDQIISSDGYNVYPVTLIDNLAPYRGERFVACSRTILSMDEAIPTPGMTTYIDRPLTPASSFNPQQQIALTKFVASLEVNGVSIPVLKAMNVKVQPQPGRLTAEYRLNGIKVHVEVTALRKLSDTTETQGGCLFKVQTSPATPVKIDCGGLSEISVWQRGRWLREMKTGDLKNKIKMQGRLALILHPEIKRAVALKSSGELKLVADATASCVQADFADGNGWIMAVFSTAPDKALALAQCDAIGAEQATNRFYKTFLSNNWIQTPERVMNEAFQSALLTMDYNWVKPFGTNECLHHWLALWQMYPTAVFDWVGLEDRSRECIAAHARLQFKSGNIPSLMQYGERRFDFGGNNPTFMWQVKHTLEATNDKSLAECIGPAVRRVTQAYYDYEDPNDNGVPGFGVQILTQEDYISTPHEGTSPAVTGIEMWRTQALVERMVGQDEAANRCEAKAKTVTDQFLALLWQRELGRLAYFRDDLGNLRPDGQYHTLVLPVIDGVLGPLDAWTSIRHLRDRLTGPNGEIYTSNNFPNHVGGVKSSPYGSTWGPQAAAYMQPWATWGLNKVGLRNEAYRALLVDARWAMMFPHLGAWMESSNELTPAYFANTAANYAQSMIEALFGLNLNVPDGVLRVQPAFPDHWPMAVIHLASVKAVYRHDGKQRSYDLETSRPLRRHLRWSLPVSRIRAVTVNGKAANYTVEPGVNCLWLNLVTAALTRSRIEVNVEPITGSIEYAKSIAEGETLRVSASGFEMSGVDDPCGVTEGVVVAPRQVDLRIKTGQLEKWLKYGRLGQLNFSRRSVFIQCKAEGQPFWAPVDLTILPPYEVAPGADLIRDRDGYRLELTVRNNTAQVVNGTGTVHLGGHKISHALAIQPRNQVLLKLPVSGDGLAALTPGDNAATLELPGGWSSAFFSPVAQPFKDQTPLREKLLQGLRTIELPLDTLVDDKQWKEFAAFPVGWQSPYAEMPPPLDAARKLKGLTCNEIPGVEFPLVASGKLALASQRLGKPSIRLDLDQTLRKLYLVILPFVENHDVFTQCGLLKITCEIDPDRPPFDADEEPGHLTAARYRQVIFSRALTTPGDLDSFFSEHQIGPFATRRGKRMARYGLLPLLDAKCHDWSEGMPLPSPFGMLPMMAPVPRDRWSEGSFTSFPQPEYWASCPAIQTETATFNVVEMDLKENRRVRRIELDSTLQDGALGLVSVIGLGVPPMMEISIPKHE